MSHANMNRFNQIAPGLFQWTDTCHVYLLKEGDAALLIDLGDGTVLDHLAELGVRRVEWILFTHHHREQCQGAVKLKGRSTKIGVPAAEKALFENPLSFRKMRPTLNDPFTVYGASYVRPPTQPIPVERAFARMDDFSWRGREFWCVHTGGNSPGHMSYLLKLNGRWMAFTGDLMLDGAKMHAWFDTEWDYGFGKGLYEMGNSAAQIAGYDPALLLPSHGPIVRQPRTTLQDYIRKLRQLADLYLRGYDLFRFAGADQDPVSKPTAVPHLWQITPHLYKFRGPDYWVNFTLLLAENGHAFLVDCGLFDPAFLDLTLGRMKARLGLKAIDAIFITHMHGDHALQADHIRKKYGAKLWAMEGVADKFERPYDYDLAALLPSYGNANKPIGPLKMDRVLGDGETFQWNEYTLTVDWMPGQTKYHSCLHGIIDGKRVAFTGDNIFAGATDPKQGGNEAVVARNGGALEEGYLYAANYLHSLGPDLLIGGHSWVMTEPRNLIERYRERVQALRAAYQALSAEEDYRYMFDPYWVQALPYRIALKPGGRGEFALLIRNYLPRARDHRVSLHTPAGLTAEPSLIEGSIPGESTRSHPIRLEASLELEESLHLIAFDITRDGIRQGQLFDCLLQISS
jgi:glyoxylase-like metal-dependent hydrolase (beta-lactamase superfamily II)